MQELEILTEGGLFVKKGPFYFADFWANLAGSEERIYEKKSGREPFGTQGTGAGLSVYFI